MKNKLFLLATLFTGALMLQSCNNSAHETAKDFQITPINFNEVQIQDGFWKNWVELTRDVTIPYSFAKCDETGRINNFIYAGDIKEGKFEGHFGFNDSDLYKIIEGGAFSLALDDDPEMEAYLDTLIYYIAAAQEDDGYLYTAWTLKANEYADFFCCTYHNDGQWIGTTDASHEFYNMGHMYEAAVAHFLATGKRSFLDIAIKNADLIYDVCMVQKKDYVPGHQEIEVGLVKLYRVTEDEKYLELAKHLMDIRAEVKDGEYGQAHLPVTKQEEAVGHAVRANYMYTAMADIAALTSDTAYLAAIGKLWDNVVSKKLSITGGVGASHEGEAYGGNYDLPNHPYNETCAAIANVYWNHRMFLLHGDAKYIDVLERSLYNGVISGLSLDGTTFFYPNTLQHDGHTTFNQGVNGRSPWFDCSCCPSNLSRFIPSVAGYAYASAGSELFVNLYMNSDVVVQTTNGKIKISQESSYPWSGNILLELKNENPVEASIHLRIPGWCRDEVVPSNLFKFDDIQTSQLDLKVNGKKTKISMQKGYAVIHKKWGKGDKIELNLPMEDRIISANEQVLAKTGLKAIQYGPIVYCAEEIDNAQNVLEAKVSDSSTFQANYSPDMLGGVNMLEGENLKLIPYYAWANREMGKMNVWFNTKE